MDGGRGVGDGGRVCREWWRCVVEGGVRGWCKGV